jgi:hypothetical protein
MQFKKKLVVERAVAEEMERICREPDTSVKKDGQEFDEEVVFDNGNRVAIQVCGSGDPANESCWTQGVLFSPDGVELGCTDVGESFLGEYWISHDDDEYIVEVVAE